jgi:hypothetical protein
LAPQYEAIIKIGVQGQRDLDAAIKQIEGLQKAVRRENRLQIRLDQGVAQSLANYNKELTKASNLLNRVGAGSKFEAAAVQQYVSALGQANAARTRQNKLIEDQTRAVQGLASASEREIEVLKRRNQISSLARPAGSANAVSAERRKAEQQLNRAAPGTDAETKAVQRLTAAIGAENKALERRNQLLGKTPAGGAAGGAGAGGRAAAQARSRLLGTISSGVIGGGFPLLFGQGAGAGAGGALGGLLGGALGGAGGFAGGILGSLIGTQLDKLAQGATAAGNALKDPVEGLQALKDAAVFAGKEQEFLVDKLIALGRISEAQAIVQQQIIEKIGVQGNNDLLALADASIELAKAWGELSLQMQAALAGPLADMLRWIADLIKLAGGLNRDNAARNDMLSGLSPQERQAYQNRRTGIQANAGFGFRGDGTLFYDNKAKELAALDAEFKKRSTPPTARTPELNPANAERQLDAAVARQKELVDLQRQGAGLIRDAEDFRRDQEEAIFGFRKRAMDYEREVTQFRKGLEDKIFEKRQQVQRSEAELARKQAQLSIDRNDIALAAAGRIPLEQGGGQSPLVDAVREYIRTRAEGEADLQQKEVNTKLEIASIQRGTANLEADIVRKIVDLRQKADDYKRDVEKFSYDTAKKIYDYQIKAADYQYEMWERSYKLAADIAEKMAAAANGMNPYGDVESASSFTSNASRGKALIGIGQRLGVSPLDLALLIQAESGGNPGIVGGAGGNYEGLIQFGPTERRQYGYRRGMGFEEQLAAGGPVENYLKDRFRRAGRSTQGASLLDLYTTVLAGNPGANPDARDSFGNSARSQVQKIERERAAVRARYFSPAAASTPGYPTLPPPGSPVGAVPATAGPNLGPLPVKPTIAPLGAPPRSIGAIPTFDAERKQLTELDQRSVVLNQQLLDAERKAVEVRNIAAQASLDAATAGVLQEVLQPLLDANKQLEDRAAYEREYGDLLKAGTLPALAEQLATQRALEKTQLRSLEIQEQTVNAAIETAKARLIEKGISADELALREQSLKKLLEIRDKLAGGKDKIIEQSDKAEQLIGDANSPEARRQGAIDKYNERINTLNDPNRLLETQLDAKARLAELSDPLNQLTTAANSFGDAFGQAFQDIVTGSKSASEAFSDMFSAIGASFAQMAAQMLAQKAVLSILGLFGGGGAAPAAGGLPGFAPGLQLFADGGRPPVGQPSIVGEDGPELFIPGMPGTIVPNEMVVPYSEGKATINPDGSTTYNASYPGAPGAPGSRGANGIGGQGRAGNSPLPALTVPFQKTSGGGSNDPAQQAQAAAAIMQQLGAIDINYNTVNVGGMDVVSNEQAQAIGRESAQQGAKIALAALQNSVGTRRKIGL